MSQTTRGEFIVLGGSAAAALYGGVALAQPGAAAPAATGEGHAMHAAGSDWREEYAYTLGTQAYVYAFPLVYLSQLRYDWTNVPDSSFYASLNHFCHKKELSNHINHLRRVAKPGHAVFLGLAGPAQGAGDPLPSGHGRRHAAGQ